jgi:hypothetical protein
MDGGLDMWDAVTVISSITNEGWDIKVAYGGLVGLRAISSR